MTDETSPFLDGDSIRLFKLNTTEADLAIEIYEYKRSDQPPYIAISHVWGDSNDTRSVKCNGSPLLITTSLFEALQTFRVCLAEEDPFLWADAICIDQESSSEKSHQVRHMDRTFREAEQVLAWFGPKGNDSELLFDQSSDVLASPRAAQSDRTRQDLLTAQDLTRYGLPVEKSPFWKALAHFYERPWFKRVWTFQENLLAQDLTLYCAHQSMKWHQLADLAFLMDDLGISYLSGLISSASNGFMTVFFCRIFRAKISEGLELNYGLIMALMREKLVSDERDRIYGILSLLGKEVSSQIDVDYSSESEEALLELYLAAGKASMSQGNRLFTFEAGNHPAHWIPGLPTWCPDPRVHELLRNGAPSGLRYERLRAGVTTESAASTVGVGPPGAPWIEVSGSHLDTIGEVGVEFVEGNEEENSGKAEVALRWEREALMLAQKACGRNGDEVPIEHIYTMGGVHPSEILDERELIREYTEGKFFAKAIAATNYSVSRSSRQSIACFTSWRRQIGRRYFTTAGGRVGIGPGKIKPGDLVSMLFGGRPLFILRASSDLIPAEDEAANLIGVTFVGDAFVHGLMDLAATRRKMPHMKVVDFRMY